MEFKYNDGGRSYAGFKGITGDCAVRAISIITEKSYTEVYNDINELAKSERIGKRKKSISNARKGVYRPTLHKYMIGLRYKWVPTMLVGRGCKVHLNENELPKGRLLVCVSGHFTSVIDGVINDTFNPNYDEKGRCVYGYYIKE